MKKDIDISESGALALSAALQVWKEIGWRDPPIHWLRKIHTRINEKNYKRIDVSFWIDGYPQRKYLVVVKLIRGDYKWKVIQAVGSNFNNEPQKFCRVTFQEGKPFETTMHG